MNLFNEKENLETSIHRKVSLSLRIETKTLCTATILLLCRYRYYTRSFHIILYRAFTGGNHNNYILFDYRRPPKALCVGRDDNMPTISARSNFTGDGHKLLLFRTRLVQRFIIILYYLPSTDRGKAAAATTPQIPHDRRFDNIIAFILL